jgi:predicted DNA-binding transcriptional regulator AlpA
MKEMDKLISIDEAMKITGKSKTYIFKKVYDKTIDSLKLGTVYRIYNNEKFKKAMNKKEEYYTVEQIAKILNVSTSLVYRQGVAGLWGEIAKGDHNKTLFNKDLFDAWISNSNETENVQPMDIENVKEEKKKLIEIRAFISEETNNKILEIAKAKNAQRKVIIGEMVEDYISMM